MGLLDKLFGKKNELPDDFPPKPKWRPDTPIDIPLILQAAKYYTGFKKQLVVMKHGTVVFCAEQVTDVRAQCLENLQRIYHAHPDFNPVAMEEGDYLISYSQPAFTIVFKDEIAQYYNYINRHHMDGVCRAEVLIDGQGRHNVFDDVGKLCLYGRAKMFMDAQAPEIVELWDPFAH